MICPHCSTSLKYTERSNFTCSGCKKVFAFEPKIHPLQISDVFFQNAVKKISGSGKYFFTEQQLQFVLSRKKMKADHSIVGIAIVGFVTSIIALAVYSPAIMVVLPFWIIVIILTFFKSKKRDIFVPQSLPEFESTVLKEWKSNYGNLPAMLLRDFDIPRNTTDAIIGILLCESPEIAACLIANHFDSQLKLFISNDPKNEVIRGNQNLPIFVLHDASFSGYGFLATIKKDFSSRKIIDIGLRPQTCIAKKLPFLREKNTARGDATGLQPAEISWLAEGFYTPLFVLTPEKLGKLVTKQIEQRLKNRTGDEADANARAVGFMTWAGE